MKISNSTPSYINPAYGNQANNQLNQGLKPQKNGDGYPTDNINLSNLTKDLQKISKAMQTEPVDRNKHVKDIKEQVESNQYNINAENIAEKMVDAQAHKII